MLKLATVIGESFVYHTPCRIVNCSYQELFIHNIKHFSLKIRRPSKRKLMKLTTQVKLVSIHHLTSAGISSKTR